MPKIMLNSVEYTGGGGDSGMELTYDEYLALPEEEKTNGTTYYIKDINGVGNDQFQPIIYSEEEREIGVWIDGKPLYQITIYLGNLSQDSSWHNVAHNIADIDKIINCVGRVQDSTMSYAIPNYRAAMNLGITLGADATTITYMNNWISATDCYITLQYTKTTDTTGSGTWTPQGIPAVHYSTDEQVVGTWIDGNTVYEKTIIVPSANYNANTGTPIWNNTGIDTLVSSNGDFYDNTRHYCFSGIYTEPNLYVRLVHDSTNTWSTDGLVLLVTGNISLTNAEFKITIRYTKQTS